MPRMWIIQRPVRFLTEEVDQVYLRQSNYAFEKFLNP